MKPGNNRQTVTQKTDREATELKNVQQLVSGKKENNKKVNWKQVVIGGIPGVLIGASAASLSDPASAHALFGDMSTEGGSGEVGEHHLDTVSDDMPFGEAFAAARAELGPGGVFEWRGGLYGTYTAEEWAEMHPQEEAMEEAIPTEEILADTSAESQTAGEVDEMASGNDENEVVVLGVSDAELNDGADVLVGNVTVDGEEVLLVDIDNNGEFDGIIVDPQDGMIDGNEIEDIQDLHLSVDEFTDGIETYDSEFSGDDAYWDDGI